MIPRFDKSSIAAWILSLATDADRAAGTVGDFSEESTLRGRAWYWRQVARTLGAHVIQDFLIAPLRILLGAVSGFVVGAGAYAVLLFSLVQFYRIWSDVYYSFVPMPTGSFIPEPPGESIVPALYFFTMHLAVGLCIARISRHALSAWTLFSVLTTALWIAFSMAAHRLAHFPATNLLLVLARVIWERRRSLKVA